MSDEQPAAVPYERFLASQRMVGGLLQEREMMMETLHALVVASMPFRHVGVMIAGQPNLAQAWVNAQALVNAYVAATQQAQKPALPITGNTSGAALVSGS